MKRRHIALLVAPAVMAGGCWFPPGEPPPPSEVDPQALSLPGSASGTVGGEDPTDTYTWTNTGSGFENVVVTCDGSGIVYDGTTTSTPPGGGAHGRPCDTGTTFFRVNPGETLTLVFTGSSEPIPYSVTIYREAT